MVLKREIYIKVKKMKKVSSIFMILITFILVKNFLEVKTKFLCTITVLHKTKSAEYIK